MKKTRTMKKVASIATAALMTACLAVPMATGLTASAATSNITITGISDVAHTFDVYQIFTATVERDEDGKVKELKDVKWGEGIISYNGTAVNAGDSVSKSVVDAIISDGARNTIGKIEFSTKKTTETSSGNTLEIDDLDEGYYVVKDVTNLNGTDEANSAWIVQVAGPTSIAIKNAKPQVDKQVLDETADAEAGHTNGWGESADHAINESFQFKLIADMPEDADLDTYTSYKLVFTDTMAESVTFESIESVTVGGTPIAASKYDCTATEGQAGGSWTLTIADLKQCITGSISNADVEVVYNAHLNEKAGIGNTDVNKNKVGLQYSNNPDATGEGGTGSLGKTSEDTVWVFTYEMPNTKLDQTGAPLAGAGFRLYNGATEIGLMYDEDLSAYRPIKEGETAEEMISAANTGKFDIKGLDAGTYTLKETTIPEGYNKCEDVSVVISAIHAEDESEATAATNISMTVDSKAATKVEVVNKFGTTLPGTGGIGTTLFYLIGGTMFAGSGVYLISKKRMKNKEEQ